MTHSRNGEAFRRRLSKREFLKLTGLTTLKTASLITIAALGGGAIGYLKAAGERGKVETITKMLYSTITKPASTTIAERSTLVSTKKETITKTETHTKIETLKTTLTKTKLLTITPSYRREFPNLAKEAKTRIWCFYYPWYLPETHWIQFTVYHPLLGEYDSSDPLVISKHIDWATGYGIETFFISWWGIGSRTDNNLKQAFLKNELSKDIKFAILYETLKDKPPFQASRIRTDIEYLQEAYFEDERYLKINGKPAIFFYLARAYPKEAEEAISEIKSSYNIYTIGDVVYWQKPEESESLMKVFDAITAYNMHTSVQSILNNFTRLLDEKYAEWYDAAKAAGVEFIPQVLPGFDDHKYPGRNNLPLPRSTRLFDEQIKIAKKYARKSTLFVTSFNEWHESTHVEPSVEEYFSYLQVIRDNL